MGQSLSRGTPHATVGRRGKAAGGGVAVWGGRVTIPPRENHFAQDNRVADVAPLVASKTAHGTSGAGGAGGPGAISPLPDAAGRHFNPRAGEDRRVSTSCSRRFSRRTRRPPISAARASGDGGVAAADPGPQPGRRLRGLAPGPARRGPGAVAGSAWRSRPPGWSVAPGGQAFAERGRPAEREGVATGGGTADVARAAAGGVELHYWHGWSLAAIGESLAAAAAVAGLLGAG